jgi:hypothetical protein
MRRFIKIAVSTVLILAAAFLLFSVAVRSSFIVMRMYTNTMQPLITTNDVVIAAKHFNVASLRSGDLVVVDIGPYLQSYPPVSHMLTVRKIEQQTNPLAGQFYLRAVSTNGIDSRQLGALPAAAIRGRVIWILRGS